MSIENGRRALRPLFFDPFQQGSDLGLTGSEAEGGIEGFPGFGFFPGPVIALAQGVEHPGVAPVERPGFEEIRQGFFARAFFLEPCRGMPVMPSGQ